MAVHVSIHDVTPAHAPEIELALERCRAFGARPALLVVPDFHHEFPLDRHPEFCARLAELQREGHEIYLHGYFHQADARAPGFRSWALQTLASNNEAEFGDLAAPIARERLAEGERMLERAGLRIDGFVAPAWMMPRWMHDILAQRGYRFTEDHLRVYDPKAGKAKPSVVLNWASRTPGRLASSVAWCRVAKRARALVPARIAIHPGDMKHPLLRHEVDQLLQWGSGDFVLSGRALLS